MNNTAKLAPVRPTQRPAWNALANSADTWFFLALAIWITRQALDITLFAKYLEIFGYRAVIAFEFLLLFLSQIHAKLDRRTVVFLAYLVPVSLVALITTKYELVLLIFFIYCARDIDFRRIARFVLDLSTALFLVVIAASQLGIILDYLWGVGVPGERIRHGLGFRYTTLPTHLLLNIVLLYGYLRREQMSWFAIGAFAVADIALYELTVSRNSFILVAFFLAFTALMKVTWISRLYTPRFQRITTTWFFPCAAAASFVASYFYSGSSSTFLALNSLLSNRLAQTHASLLNYGVHPFGQDVTFVGNGLNAAGQVVRNTSGDYDLNFIDNSYMLILVNYGYVLFAAVMVAFMILGFHAARNNDKFLSAILFVIAVHSLIDPQLIDLLYDSFLLLMLSYPYRSTPARIPSAQASQVSPSALRAYSFPYMSLPRR